MEKQLDKKSKMTRERVCRGILRPSTSTMLQAVLGFQNLGSELSQKSVSGSGIWVNWGCKLQL